MKDHNLILFPKLKEQMRQDIETYMQERNYDKALQLLLSLLISGEKSYELNRDTLTCMIQLDQLEDALQLCTELLQNKHSPDYNQYLDFYIIALYEAKRYVDLAEVIDNEQKTGMDDEHKHKLADFKTLALQMILFQKEELQKKLSQAMKEENMEQQYFIIQQWHQQKLGIPTMFFSMLKDTTIHPVIKTILFNMMQEGKVDRDVTVNKFKSTGTFSPVHTLSMTEYPSYKRILSYLEHVEQKNPSLYMLAKELLDHYMFVHYPFGKDIDEEEMVAETIKFIAEGNLNFSSEKPNDLLIENIFVSLQLYDEMMLQ